MFFFPTQIHCYKLVITHNCYREPTTNTLTSTESQAYEIKFEHINHKTSHEQMHILK